MTSTRTAVRRRVRRSIRAFPLTVLDRLATPLVPADFLDLVNPLRPGADLRGRVEAVHPETADAATLVVRPGADWAGHRPGQHVRVGVDVDGVRHHRTYSLTAAPGGETISITPKRISGGLVSTHLVDRARAGDLLHLGQAEGDFTVPGTPPPAVLFVTAGSGLTPALGMLRAGLADVTDVVLVHSERRAADMIAGAEIRALAESGVLRLIERETATEGRLRIADLTEAVPDWAERETWACGPAELLDVLTAHWADHNLAGRLHTERFNPPARPEVGPGGAGGAVTFTASVVEVDAPGDRSLLEVGEEAGVLMPSGCRMGICHGCLTPLRSGSVQDLRTGELVSAPADGPLPIQTCINSAAGPVHLDR